MLTDDWIHDIYRCATGELPWEAGLRPLMAELKAVCAGVVKHSIAPVSAEVLVRVDIDAATEQSYVDHYVRENPAVCCLSAMPLGYITAGSGAMDEKFFFQSPFYLQWQKPAGYADNLGISVARRQGQFVLLSLPRDFNHGPYSRDEVSLVLPYVQHLVRAFNIWLRLKSSEAETGWVSEALDQTAQGLIILGEKRTILYANRNGERLLAESGVLARADYRLLVTKPAIRDQFDAIISKFENGTAEETAEYNVVCPREDGRSPLFVRVQPPLGLKPGQRNFGIPTAIAFIHVVDPDQRLIGDTLPLSNAYGLTKAEARMLDCLVRLESVIEAARHMNISEATARTHMQRIYAKTATANLAGLLAKVYRTLVR